MQSHLQWMQHESELTFLEKLQAATECKSQSQSAQTVNIQ